MSRLFKWVKYLAIASIIIFGLSFAVVYSFSVYERPIQKADAIIILGAAINTPALYNRSMEGLGLYQSGKSDVLILSGGRISNEDITEAGYMKKVIMQNNNNNNVEQPKMILEEDSHSTFENIRNSKNKAPEVKSIIVVSDKYHLARAVLLAKRMGFKPVYWSAPSSDYYPKKELYYHYLRETVAIVAYLPKLAFNR
jgi:uncharacterized SAM-binding protein YcdF (DUF218 family)